MITLTYRPGARPQAFTLHGESYAAGSLQPLHLREFYKRLRRRFQRSGLGPLRHFSAGEYSPRGLPHYHAVLFGADGSTKVHGVPLKRVIESAWGLGRVHVGSSWSPQAAGYVSGYVAKGYNSAGLDVLAGRFPEFARFPQRPGLGVPGLPLILPQLLAGREARELVAELGDVPSFLQLGDRPRFLGGFLLGKVRQLAGLTADESAAIRRRASSQRSWDARAEGLTALLAEAIAESDSDTAQWAMSALAVASPAASLMGSATLRFFGADPHPPQEST